MNEKLDRFDRMILDILQSGADRSVAEIAERVGLSKTPCWRRIQRLENAGVIRRRVALLDRKAVNVPVTVFVRIRTNQHNPKWLEAFANAIQDIDEIVEAYRMSGETDYVLRVVVPDIQGYDHVYKRLIAAAPMYNVSSSFAMEELKYTTELPLAYTPGA